MMLVSSMVSDYLIVFLLGGLLIYQQRFYSQQIKDLVDRLMSRSIGEFEQAKRAPAPPRVVIKPEEPQENLDRILG